MLKYLTKSKFMQGQQCHRLLWLSDRGLLPAETLGMKHRFDQGREFEKYAIKFFPGIVDLSDISANDENVQQTSHFISRKKTIFQAGIKHEKLFVKCDILEPYGDEWNLYEIKATTEAKKEHYPDLAFQKYVLEKSGMKVARCLLIHLNKEYVKNGPISPRDLVSIVDVSSKVNEITDIEEKASKFLVVLQNDDEPGMTISQLCNKPYECPLKEQCWGTLPEDNVLLLKDWQLYWKLFNEGIISMRDIPVNTSFKPADKIIYDATLNGRVFINENEIDRFLNNLNFPLVHLDFETFDTAIPIYDNSRPYQKIPFQFSVHVQKSNNTLVHYEFLADDVNDPRIKLLPALNEAIAAGGDIIVYHKTFEISILKELARDFPENNSWITDALTRIVDLATPFKKYLYYNPVQKGKWSIKKVLPAITGRGYDDMEINNGLDASVQFFYSHIKNSLGNKNDIRKSLLEYCKLDTEGMVWIINRLHELVHSN